MFSFALAANMIWFFYLALVTPLSSASSVYYHEFSKKSFSITNMEHNSYFGYSIAYDPESKTLIVSAPLSNIAGDVFLCNINKGSCDPIQANLSLCTENKIYGRQNMWMGAMVKSAPSYYVTCAPRCTKLDSHFSPVERITEGYCWFGRSTNLMYPEPLKPISDKKRYTGKYYRVERAMLNFGWSMDVFEKSIAIGGPAMRSGRLEKYSKSEDIPIYVDGNERGVNYNFGYSVASGYFIKGQNDICYAVGSTYGTRGYGKVVILFSHGLAKKGDLLKDEFMHKSSEYQVGSMYGSVLCTASFTGYRRDLLVGAPTYAAEHQQNTGAVYVYVRGKSNMPVNKRIIIGEHDKSFFGSAIVSIGDLNNDEKDEFAIAAPYEADGRGTVYLYSGADVLQLGKPFRPLQKILPESNWRTFGLSLSSLQDYDENGCNELAIGAPESDQVLLLRCMASVHVEVFIQVPDFNSSLTSSKSARKESFEYQSCLKVRYPKKPKDIIATIQMKVIIRHQGAKLRYPEEATYEVSLRDKNETYCKSIEVLTPENGNYDMAIDINVTATHIDNPIKQRTFDSSHVILGDNSVLTSNALVWAAECTGNNRCMPNLNYTFTEFSVSRESYVIGSTPTISATIWVKNHGEAAYDACVYLQIFDVAVLTSPAGCERKEENSYYSWLKCSPKQLIRTGETWNTNQIILDTAKLTNLDKEITIKGAIYDRCKETNNPKIFNETIQLVSDTDGVTVRGLTDFGTENNVYMTQSDIAVGKAFEHIYQISNNGPTTWVNIDFQVEVQKLPFIEIYDVTIQINDAETICKNKEIKRKKNTYLIYNCMIDKLSKYPILVLLPMRVKPVVVGDLIEDGKNLTVYSVLSFELQTKKIKSASVTSMVTKRELSVPLWVIICTAFLGLIILAIIAFILRELGFLRRKNKDKLERVRKSVRRQTVLRRQSQNEQSERERVGSAEIQSMLAQAAKEQHDRRVRVPSTE